MNDEIKDTIIMYIGVFCILIISVGGFLWYVGYMMNETKKEIHNNLLDNLVLNNSYDVVDVSSSFVSGNECMFFVSIVIKNETDIINLNDFSYDNCEDKLYYGWYYYGWYRRNVLDEKYGKIINY